MSKIVQFQPRVELSARDNVRAFVSYCKNELTTFGAELPFHLNRWDVSHVFRRKGTNTAVTIAFDDWEANRSGGSPPMSEPTRSLAKSFIRYRQALKLSGSFAFQLIAFRALEMALREYGMTSKPWVCNADVIT